MASSPLWYASVISIGPSQFGMSVTWGYGNWRIRMCSLKAEKSPMMSLGTEM